MNKSIHQDVFSGFIMLLVSVVFFMLTTDLPDRAALFPKFILSILLFFSIAIIINGFIKTAKAKKGEQVSKGDEEERITFSKVKRPLFFLFLLSIYVLLMNFLGFFISTSILIVVVLYLLHVRKLLTFIFTVLGINMFIYILFVRLLHVNLPQGILF